MPIKATDGSGVAVGQRQTTRTVEATSLSKNALLARQLSDTSSFVNTELPQRERYGFALQQIEDRQLYREAWDFSAGSWTTISRLTPAFTETFDYLQKRRSVSILRNAPTFFADAARPNGTPPRGALVAIGMAHLADIIAFLIAGQVPIAVPRSLLDNPMLAARVSHAPREGTYSPWNIFGTPPAQSLPIGISTFLLTISTEHKSNRKPMFL